MKVEVHLRMNVRELRKKADLSLDQIAKLSGIHKSILSRIESDVTPSLGNALRYARFLQKPVEKIWTLKNCKNRS